MPVVMSEHPKYFYIKLCNDRKEVINVAYGDHWGDLRLDALHDRGRDLELARQLTLAASHLLNQGVNGEMKVESKVTIYEGVPPRVYWLVVEKMPQDAWMARQSREGSGVW